MLERIKNTFLFLLGAAVLHMLAWLFASPLFTEERESKSAITYFNPCADVGKEICTYSLSLACSPSACNIGYLSLPAAIILLLLCALFWVGLTFVVVKFIVSTINDRGDKHEYS